MYQSWLSHSVQTAALVATMASVLTRSQRYRIEHRTFY